jgi:hypothetical protein
MNLTCITLEFFAPRCSQFLLLVDLQKTILNPVLKTPSKKTCETKKLEPIHEYHFVEQKTPVENLTKTRFCEGSSLWPETLTKNVVQEFHLWIVISYWL